MPPAEPLYFGPADRPIFGWLHRSSSPGLVGLVVCNPFGFEAICSHRSLRHFGEAAAAVGFPALRFDYDGTGDSAGDDRDPGRLAAWVASAREAIDTLRRLAGVGRVVIMGVRLGALIAALASEERQDVHGLIAIAPVVSGKAYLRELRALQLTLGLREAPHGTVADSCAQESIGFCLTHETQTALAAVDLTTLGRPAPQALILDRNDLPGSDAWAARLTSQGVAVERRTLGGYVEMMLEPHHAVVPDALLSAVVEWLRAQGPSSGRSRATSAGPRRAEMGPIVESAEGIDRDGRLFGILSEPVKPPSARRGILLLSAGAVHRIGPNRLYVTLARRWAALGHAVLRMDASGIGDSPPRPGSPENVVYTDHASDDVAAGLELLKKQPGVTEVYALGLCSGGYNGFKAAVAGVPMNGVLLINPLTFFYEPGMPLDKRDHNVASEARRYRERLRSLEAWKKLLQGGVDLDVPVRTLARRLGNLAKGRARRVAQRVGLRVRDDLAQELKAVVRRGTVIRFVFSGDDPGMSLLEEGAGPTVEELRKDGQLSIDVIDGPDHTFTPRWSHPALIAAVARAYDGMPR